MFWRKLWNSLVLLVSMLACVVFILVIRDVYKKGEEFKKYGKLVAAHIDKVYKGQNPQSYKIDKTVYFIDYSYVANGQKFVVERHRVKVVDTRDYEKPDPGWKELQAGDKLDIVYLENRPGHHFIVMMDKDPRDSFGMILFFSLFLFSFAVVFIFSVNWSSVLGLAFVTTSMLAASAMVLDHMFTVPLRGNSILGCVIFLLVALPYCIFVTQRFINLWCRGQRAIAVITDYKVRENSGRGMYFIQIYTYEYEDTSGQKHIGQRMSFLLYATPKKIGDRVRVIYLPKKPRIHWRLGLES